MGSDQAQRPLLDRFCLKYSQEKLWSLNMPKLEADSMANLVRLGLVRARKQWAHSTSTRLEGRGLESWQFALASFLG